MQDSHAHSSPASWHMASENRHQLQTHSGRTFPCCRTAASRTLCCRTSLSISTFKTQHHSSRSSLLRARNTSIFCCPFRDGTSLTLPRPGTDISSFVFPSNRTPALASKHCGSSTARSRYLSQPKRHEVLHEMDKEGDEPKDNERIPVIVTRL
jgi:hypothetical protein